MRKLFDAWLGIIIIELIVLAVVTELSAKYIFFMLAVIMASSIVGATYLVLKKGSVDSNDI
ncbi:hypothetical protein BP422_12115 [Brevibacillus formosus]|uniref:Uncharacterized protein n=1 Tax=Brevibacillus formosus TaxID=54913 RepID=A0A220MGT4_9BACL|nr:hypothetical protein [Brevibacillus formosus]ASJ54227.1 hypothetical protein BP422_12115 [Brevibacillus formosus]